MIISRSKKAFFAMLTCMMLLIVIYVNDFNIDKDKLIDSAAFIQTSRGDSTVNSVIMGVDAVQSAENQRSGLTSSRQLVETPGVSQGFWSDSSGNTLSDADFQSASNTINLNENQVKSLFGIKDSCNEAHPVYLEDQYADLDPFKQIFGDSTGYIRYSQSGAGNGTFLGVSYNGVTLGTSGCGVYATSHGLSTLLHRYITPSEVLWAIGTYNDRHNTNSMNTSFSALPAASAKLLFEEQMYNGQQMFTAEASRSTDDNVRREKAKKALEKGGFVMLVKNANNGRHWTASYAIVTGDRVLVADSVAWSATLPRGDKPVDLDFFNLSGCGNPDIVFVTPAPGYQAYLRDGQQSSSSSSSLTRRNIDVQAMIDYAKQFEGNPYVWGGNDPHTGADCSGFVSYVYKHFGYRNIPRSSSQQAAWMDGITEAELEPGDLVFYGSNGAVRHVALYIGNGKIIHAMDDDHGILISNMHYNPPLKYGKRP